MVSTPALRQGWSIGCFMAARSIGCFVAAPKAATRAWSHSLNAQLLCSSVPKLGARILQGTKLKVCGFRSARFLSAYRVFGLDALPQKNARLVSPVR